MNLKKVKVEELEETKMGGYSIKFSGEYNGTALLTKNNLPLPPEVTVGATVDAEIKEVPTKSGSGTWTAVNFPKPEDKSRGEGPSWKGGRQEDVELKIVSFSMSYAKDLFVSTPESTLKGMFDTADQIAAHMFEMYKRLKG